MRTAGLVLLLLAILLPFAAGQTTLDRTLETQLKRVFPNATAFSPKQTNPVPHYIAYTAARALRPSRATYSGRRSWSRSSADTTARSRCWWAWTSNAHLTGVLVTEHHEPYGYFSVDPPEFAQQFRGKDIRDPFKVGADVAAVSRASISINSSSRAIRNGARRVARALLTPPGQPK